jgi:hypothetical protein
MKNSQAVIRVLVSTLGLLIGGFLGGACGIAVAVVASAHGEPTPLGAPGAGLIVVLTLPLGVILGAASGLLAGYKLVGIYSDRVSASFLCMLLVLLVVALAMGVLSTTG